jgi:hypothetical protein
MMTSFFTIAKFFFVLLLSPCRHLTFASVTLLSQDPSHLRPHTLAALSLLLSRMFALPSSATAFVAASGCGVIISLLSSLQARVSH